MLLMLAVGMCVIEGPSPLHASLLSFSLHHACQLFETSNNSPTPSSNAPPLNHPQSRAPLLHFSSSLPSLLFFISFFSVYKIMNRPIVLLKMILFLWFHRLHTTTIYTTYYMLRIVQM